MCLLIFCVYPLAFLVSKGLFSGPGGSFTLEYLEKAILSDTTSKAIINTAWVSFFTALLSVFIATPLAWILSRSNLPKSKLWRSLFSLPYAIPPYIGAIAWIYLANPSNGILVKLFGLSFLNIYSFIGLIWVMSSFLYTFVLLSLLASLDRMDPSLEEAARISGASPIKVFFQITLPLIAPALIGSSLLVALAAAASFGVPALIGNPARIFLMTTKIYTFQKMGSMSGIYTAIALSIILFVLALIVLTLNSWLTRKSTFQVVSGKASRPSLVELGKLMLPAKILLGFLFFLLFLLPVAGILITALNKVQGVFSFSNLGFQNFYRVLFETDETSRAFFNSAYLGFVAATLATGLGMILAYIQWKTTIKGRHWLDVFASLPYSTPGTVVGLALILAFSHGILGLTPSLYNTLTLIWIAYAVKYLSFAIRTTGDGFGQIDDSLAEASRVAGASWWTSLRTIWFPLMKPSLIAAWFLIFMPSFSELTMTILLSGPGIETVGTLLFQLQEYADASGGAAAVLALTIIVCVALVNWSVKTLSKGKYGL